jgi:hypothetical protein
MARISTICKKCKIFRDLMIKKIIRIQEIKSFFFLCEEIEDCLRQLGGGAGAK